MVPMRRFGSGHGDSSTTMQSQKALTAYLKSEQLLSFGCGAHLKVGFWFVSGRFQQVFTQLVFSTLTN